MEELYDKFNYPSAGKFKEILKQNNIKATGKQIEAFINSKTVNQVHKPIAKQKRQYKFIVAYEPYEILQVDLLDYQKYSRTNKGYKFILIAVDVFTRFAYAVGIKDKTPKNVLQAFKSFKIPKLTSIYHDSGSEFKGDFLKYLNDNNIIDIKATVGDHRSLGIIDRFSRTIKSIIAKHMTETSTAKYANVLPQIISSYNQTPHSALNNIPPIQAFEGEPYQYIKQLNHSKMIHNKQIVDKITDTIKIQVGDQVRKQLKKKTFAKSNEQTYTKTVYKVESIEGDTAILSDGSSNNLQNLIIATNEEINNPQIEKANAEAKLKRKMRKEGLI